MAISVVTCCMNRNDQLAETIGQWLMRDWVDQIVIVDWSSDKPVAETLKGMFEDRLCIIRAEEEESWVLSYAYNLGIVHATGDMILKIDADCFVDDRIVTDCQPDGANFYAGNWRVGLAMGKTKSVNGQCFFTRGAFEAVNGFSELIRGWGYDDEDFYHRMHAKGIIRRDIDCGLLDFIDHSDDRRIANAPPSEGRNAQKVLEQQPYVQQVKNIVVATDMVWGQWFPRARYRRLGSEGAVTHVQRLREFEIPIPSAVKAVGLLQAGRMVLQQIGFDPGTLAALDYPGIVDLFERWLVASRETLATAA